MSTSIGELFGVRQPQAGETTRIYTVLLDDSGDRVSGITHDAAGMAVKYCKDGDSTFTDFALAAANWAEVGHGLYCLVLRGDVSAEADIFDTAGLLAWYVECDATRGDIFVVKVSPADVTRIHQWTDTKAGYIDAAISSRSSHTAGDVAAAVWDTLTSALTTTGSIGKKLAGATWATIIDVIAGPYKLSADQDVLQVRWGDGVTIPFTLYDSDGELYDFSNVDKLYFTVKSREHLDSLDDSDAVIGDGAPKEMSFDPLVAGSCSVVLTPADTMRCEMNLNYRFDIRVINAAGDSPSTAVVGIFTSAETVTRTA